MLFDTSFFVHLGRGGKGHVRAVTFLAGNPNAPLFTSRIVWEELAEGVATAIDADAIVTHFTVLEVTREVAWQTAQVARTLKAVGLHIGDNDAWIAGTALAYGLPLVTDNARHFQRVSGLTVVGY